MKYVRIQLTEDEHALVKTAAEQELRNAAHFCKRVVLQAAARAARAAREAK